MISSSVPLRKSFTKARWLSSKNLGPIPGCVPRLPRREGRRMVVTQFKGGNKAGLRSDQNAEPWSGRSKKNSPDRTCSKRETSFVALKSNSKGVQLPMTTCGEEWFVIGGHLPEGCRERRWCNPCPVLSRGELVFPNKLH